MPTPVKIILGTESIDAHLNDSATSQAILNALPFTCDYQTWGDEIYFTIPVKAELENGKETVSLGELAYWPAGNAFCIFYGATPMSPDKNTIVPASAVSPVGNLAADAVTTVKTLAGKNRTIRIETVD